MTTPNNHKTKALSIKETWGKRCDVNLFISSATDVTLPTVALNVSEGRDNLWAKTKAAFEHVYQNYSKKADWFLKADDDTYVIIENLRQFLQDKNASEPLYFGKRLKPHLTQGYMSGGAGYVLSHKALERLVTEGFRNSSICETQKRKDEDLEIGKCFDHLGIVPGDTRDDKERERFMSYRIEQHLYPQLMLPLTRNYSYYPQKKMSDRVKERKKNKDRINKYLGQLKGIIKGTQSNKREKNHDIQTVKENGYENPAMRNISDRNKSPEELEDAYKAGFARGLSEVYRCLGATNPQTNAIRRQLFRSLSKSVPRKLSTLVIQQQSIGLDKLVTADQKNSGKIHYRIATSHLTTQQL
ncbi:hypothetical protein FSP39_017276 [Pinctada imbricata]|uniref:Glycoprotein-N-acetylgalactosamine 3-beta-galactosyltransferase 1 n=1 Tax=Pinctada imbricata TaxID=66713 RepID=A0AA88YK44_PINIB|nr:hypothetical protein FSP39_017276 [Pinctada imbricata]